MDKKNAIILTVIAVFTLLVTLIGATFAYFTAQQGEGTQAPVTVTTATSDSLNYGSFGAIVINATQKNFFEGAGDQQGSTSGSVTLKANSVAEAAYCYTVALAVTANDLEYTTVTEEPELLISFTKKGTEITTISDKKYVNLGSRKICDNEDCTTNHNAPVKGFDITTAAISDTAIRVPTPENSTEYVHRITAGADTTTSDDWTATVTLVNLDSSQQRNTNKQFTATFRFDTVTCS